MPCTLVISPMIFSSTRPIGAPLSDLIGLSPKPATRTEGACASSALAFREGVLALASGMYDLVLVGGLEEMSKRTTEEVAEGLALASTPYEGLAGFTIQGSSGPWPQPTSPGTGPSGSTS